jgi:hypothetical protein
MQSRVLWRPLARLPPALLFPAGKDPQIHQVPAAKPFAHLIGAPTSRLGARRRSRQLVTDMLISKLLGSSGAGKRL